VSGRLKGLLTRLCNAIVAAIWPDELLLAIGLVLLTVGLWPLLAQVALIAPGVVLVWMTVPTRARFVAPPDHHPAEPDERRKS
jgi:hypothetical protein